MKLISLNTFGGTFFESLIEFVEREESTTDIFCFQEILSEAHDATNVRGMRMNLFIELRTILADFDYVSLVTNHKNQAPEEGYTFGKTIFVKKPMQIETLTDHTEGAFLVAKIKQMNTEFIVCNVHGRSLPGEKFDTAERLEQSKNILDFLAAQSGEKIICGDFNLLPQTQSIKMFEEAGYKNLITDFAITTTRGTLHKKTYPEYANLPDGFQEFADYTFVMPGILVKSFDVPDLSLSDHLPMILNFDVIQ